MVIISYCPVQLKLKLKDFKINTENPPTTFAYTSSQYELKNVFLVSVVNQRRRRSQQLSGAAPGLAPAPLPSPSLPGAFAWTQKVYPLSTQALFAFMSKNKGVRQDRERDGRYLKQKPLHGRSKAAEGHLGLLSAQSTDDPTWLLHKCQQPLWDTACLDRPKPGERYNWGLPIHFNEEAWLTLTAGISIILS